MKVIYKQCWHELGAGLFRPQLSGNCITFLKSKCCRIVAPISKIIMHEDFIEVTEGNDIALIKLQQSVDLGTYTPVCLPSVGDSFTGENGWVYGQF